MPEGWRGGVGALKRMMAIRNMALPDDQSLLLPILVNVITRPRLRGLARNQHFCHLRSRHESALVS